ncbi:MAG: hypothetical protein ACRETW_10695 [Stenotrophobium sp.]
MRLRVVLFAIAGIAILIVLFWMIKPDGGALSGSVSTPQGEGVAPLAQVQQFDLQVKGRRLIVGPALIRVHEGDRIAIRIVCDEVEELHLHGYDRKLELEPNRSATLELVADRSGRFEYELEKSGTELGALEVSPR